MAFVAIYSRFPIFVHRMTGLYKERKREETGNGEKTVVQSVCVWPGINCNKSHFGFSEFLRHIWTQKKKSRKIYRCEFFYRGLNNNTPFFIRICAGKFGSHDSAGAYVAKKSHVDWLTVVVVYNLYKGFCSNWINFVFLLFSSIFIYLWLRIYIYICHGVHT